MIYGTLMICLVAVLVWGWNLSQNNDRWNRNWFLVSVALTCFVISLITYKKD